MPEICVGEYSATDVVGARALGTRFGFVLKYLLSLSNPLGGIQTLSYLRGWPDLPPLPHILAAPSCVNTVMCGKAAGQLSGNSCKIAAPCDDLCCPRSSHS